jgi:predicted DNA-binding ribbon-helix-helix protein
MCKIFSSLSYDEYGFQTRSVRLGGHVTSIRLEAMFWRVLEEIAARENSSVGRFLSKLHDEVLAFERNPQNFTSLLRCACLTYLRQGANETTPRIDAMTSATLARRGVGPRAVVGMQRPD